jgi:hypothetical protein
MVAGAQIEAGIPKVREAAGEKINGRRRQGSTSEGEIKTLWRSHTEIANALDNKLEKINDGVHEKELCSGARSRQRIGPRKVTGIFLFMVYYTQIARKMTV